MKTKQISLAMCALFFLVAVFLQPVMNAQSTNNDNGDVVSENLSNNLQKQVDVYFFTKIGCSHCVAVKPIVHEICSTYTVSLHELDIYYNRSNLDLLYDFAKRYCIPEEQLGVPVIFAGKNVLIGDAEINKNLKNVLSNALQKNIDPLIYKKQCNDSNSTLSADQTITWATVIFASAFDSINPCAIGVLLIFLSFLMISHTFSRRKVLLYGLVYVLAIYITYLAAGLGILQLLRGFDLFYLILFQITVIAILIIAAFIEFRDAFVTLTKKGKLIFAISDKAKPFLQKWMKKGTLAATIVLGCLVSLFELPCTGQVYLGILAKLSGSDIYQGLLYLVVYNFIFVLPLLAILLLLLFGKTSLDRLTMTKSRFSWLSHYILSWVILALAVLLANDVVKQIKLKHILEITLPASEIYILLVIFLLFIFVIVALLRLIISKYMKVCALCFAFIFGVLALSVLFLLGAEIPRILLAGLLGMLCTGIWFELKKLDLRFFGIFTIFWIFEIVALSYSLFAGNFLAYVLLMLVVFATIGIIQFKDQEARALKKGNPPNEENLEKNEFKKENIIDIYFFTKKGCQHCEAVKPIVCKLCSKYKVLLHELEIGDKSNIDLLLDFAKRYCISEDKLETPVIFVGTKFLIGDKDINKNLKKVLTVAVNENIRALAYQKTHCDMPNKPSKIKIGELFDHCCD